MKIRTKCPEKNNRYYNNKRHGGLSDAVNGEPMIKGLTVLENCVGWANSRFNEIINDPDLKGIVKAFRYQLVCNAENFIESAKRQGLKISKTPIQGGIMVWQKGRTLGGGDGAGHVAVVEEVYDDGTILTSESGYRAWTFKTIRRSNDNGRWGQNSNYKFRGCIVNPSVKNPKVVPAPKLTVDGVGGANTVRAMQKFFGTPQDGVISGQLKRLNKYYPALTAVEYGRGGSTCVTKLQKWLGVTQDGVIGQKTVKAWQKKLGVTADGIFGENSMRAWQKYLNEHDKAVYPTVKPTSTATAKPVAASTIQDKICAKAKQIADSGKYTYVNFDSQYGKECAICHPHNGKNKGWNCIGYAFACWHHAGIKCKCNCGVITNQLYEKMLKSSAKEATKIAQERIGIKDVKVVRNGGKTIPISKLKKGDIIVYFKGSKYVHTALYVGDGKIADCTSGRTPHIKYGVKPYSKWTIKLAIRYTGK